MNFTTSHTVSWDSSSRPARHSIVGRGGCSISWEKVLWEQLTTTMYRTGPKKVQNFDTFQALKQCSRKSGEFTCLIIFLSSYPGCLLDEGRGHHHLFLHRHHLMTITFISFQTSPSDCDQTCLSSIIASLTSSSSIRSMSGELGGKESMYSDDKDSQINTVLP